MTMSDHTFYGIIALADPCTPGAHPPNGRTYDFLCQKRYFSQFEMTFNSTFHTFIAPPPSLTKSTPPRSNPGSATVNVILSRQIQSYRSFDLTT